MNEPESRDQRSEKLVGAIRSGRQRKFEEADQSGRRTKIRGLWISAWIFYTTKKLVQVNRMVFYPN